MTIAWTFDETDHGDAVGGLEYTLFLSRLHAGLKPRTYFEIGTAKGDTLALARCRTVAVDPAFQLRADFAGADSAGLLFEETSDAFFQNRNLSAILGGAVDLAFLDGMHQAEFLLRDFINTERHCTPRSLVVLHDCLPPGFAMTTRDKDSALRQHSRFPGYWTGDVWQVVRVLQKFRPDLSITLLDSAPTGLVVISNLDPTNDGLARTYRAITTRVLPRLASRAAYDAYWGDAWIVPTAPFLAGLVGARANAPVAGGAAAVTAREATGAAPASA